MVTVSSAAAAGARARRRRRSQPPKQARVRERYRLPLHLSDRLRAVSDEPRQFACEAVVARVRNIERRRRREASGETVEELRLAGVRLGLAEEIAQVAERDGITVSAWAEAVSAWAEAVLESALRTAGR